MSRARQIGARLLRWGRRIALGLVAATIVLGLVLVVAVYAWSYPVDLLDPDRGGPLLITDRHGRLLRSVPGPEGRPGRAAWIGVDAMPAAAVMAVIAAEDEAFYDHGGVDSRGVARAMWLNAKAGRFAYGGSTLTMQLVRMIEPELRPPTLANKVRQAVVALRLERAVDKRTILEQYLNRAYYGNGAYGIEAAAQLYFAKPAASLSDGEATLLAVLPRAPSAYDPLANLDRALRRRDHVLDLMSAAELFSADQVTRIRAEPLAPALHRPEFRAPHFTEAVLAALPLEVRARGGVVRTTLDLSLQQELEYRVAEHVAGLRDRDVEHAGVVVLDSRSGEVLAMVGSADRDAARGHLNIIMRRRHPGSSLKPFVYALAIERGDSPATIVNDIHEVPSGYRVNLLSQREHGPVRYREALAGSYNLAAVHVLEKVGVGSLMSVLARAGVGPLAGSADDYGLRLALGSARVRLLDLASAYGFLVRRGRVRAPTMILAAESDGGQRWRPPSRPERRIFSPQTSWLVMDMLADPAARHHVFGRELPLDLPFPVAAKTGTAQGFADTVALGVTREYTVAAWAGNFDGQATRGVIAMQGAAPLVRAGLLAAARGRRLSLPGPPAGLAESEVCARSGLLPSAHCHEHKIEWFVAGNEPSASCDWHRPSAGGFVEVHYPGPARGWGEQARREGGRNSERHR